MKIVRSLTRGSRKETVVLSIGTYDGIHRGHCKVLQTAVRLARASKAKAAVLTFTAHPLKLFTEHYPARLITDEKRNCYFEKLGVDTLLLLDFTRALAELTPEAFIEKLTSCYNIKHIVVGYNFRFGRDNVGDAAMLAELGKKYGFKVKIIPPQYHGRYHVPISSTLIREELTAGNVEHAQALLGRPYAISGKVIRGKKFGRTIGFPTLNIEITDLLLPGPGIYAAQMPYNGKTYGAMLFIGKRSQFLVGTSNPVVAEANILDFNKNLYGQTIEILVLHKTRQVKEFDNAESLQRQLKHDEETIRAYLKTQKVRRKNL